MATREESSARSGSRAANLARHRDPGEAAAVALGPVHRPPDGDKRARKLVLGAPETGPRTDDAQGALAHRCGCRKRTPQEGEGHGRRNTRCYGTKGPGHEEDGYCGFGGGGPGRGPSSAGGRGEAVTGTSAGDALKGTPADDTIRGLGGEDALRGNAGWDSLFGGGGDDVLHAGAGKGALFGGTGNDTVSVGDGQRDLADCGDGVDTVKTGADRNLDRFVNCERFVR